MEEKRERENLGKFADDFKNKQERQSLTPISLGNWPDISCFHKI